MDMFDKIKWFNSKKEKPTEEIPFSEERYKRELDSFLFQRINNQSLTDAGREKVIADIDEHIRNGVTKEEISNDLKTLSRDSFISKYAIERRSIDQKVSDEMNTATLRMSGILTSKGFTESGIELLLIKAQDEIADNPEVFLQKLENMSSDQINKNYFH